MDVIAPPDPALNNLTAKIAATTAELGCGPAEVLPGLERGRRVAELRFATVDDLIAWVTWLHWPYATSGRGGRHIVVGYGQWLGYACTLTGSEPLDDAPAAG